MTTERSGRERFRVIPQAGQVVLPFAPAELAPPGRVRALYRLSDLTLSELGLEELLDELLIRVRDALEVDTVAILLLDEQANQLVARAAKGIEEEVEQGVRIPIGLGFAGRIAAERVAIFIADVDHADILNPILREKGIRSLLGVPLIVEGHVVGVLHVGSLRPRKFDQRDLAVLQVAAARVAPGIERARLYSALEREHRLAIMLQRSLLPTELVDTLGIEVSARYLPASDEVGGDWYDVFELPDGRLGIAIGDVVGHGARAAAMMGQLRTALRAYALESYGAARTLDKLDSFLQSLPGMSMATSAYAVLDPASGALQLACAGHLPPMIVGRNGSRILELAPQAPLGVSPYASRTEHNLTLAPGEILVLYTDGLVERPPEPVTQSIEELAELIAGAHSPEMVCRRSLELVPLDGLRDDAAIIAIQHVELPATLNLRLPAVPDTLVAVRRILRRWLTERGAGDVDVMEITLAVNEACANAVEHAYSPAPAQFELEASLEGDQVVIKVADRGRWRPQRGRDRGRGMTIIEAAMDSLDLAHGDHGTSVTMRRTLRG